MWLTLLVIVDVVLVRSNKTRPHQPSNLQPRKNACTWGCWNGETACDLLSRDFGSWGNLVAAHGRLHRIFANHEPLGLDEYRRRSYAERVVEDGVKTLNDGEKRSAPLHLRKLNKSRIMTMWGSWVQRGNVLNSWDFGVPADRFWCWRQVRWI